MDKKNYILFSFLLLIFSCRKTGTGGDATIVANIKHHATAIKGATVYVKFDTDEYPSNPTTDYDLKIVGASNESHVHIEGLLYGKYYLYAEGFDSTDMIAVKGGLPVKIKWSKRKKEIDIDVPVAE